MASEWNGTLSVSIGETALSSYELATLKPGDIVVTEREAGYPSLVLFNNLPLGMCEIVVFDEELILGARITDSDFRSVFDLSPKRMDELGELVPVSVSLASIPFDLAACRGLGRNSIINLGVSSAGEENAELLVAGIPMARGQVVVVEEAMGLRVTKVIRSFPAVQAPRATGNIGDAETSRTAKPYDFCRPDRFSRDQLRRFSAIHVLCARNLGARFPDPSTGLQGLTCSVVDQCTFREAIDAFREDGLVPGFTAERASQKRETVQDEASPARPVYEDEHCPKPMSAETRAMVERINSELGILGRRSPLFVLFSASSASKAVFAQAPERRTFLSCLSTGWKNHADFRMVPSNATDAAIAYPDNEMVIVVLLSREGEKPSVGLIYPFLTVEPYLSILGS
ncbi:MAG: FliM/FliN family flagellar motor switch protein [Spirochaetes bacterium]|nr:FliM/FliN family flagellar motor switch protein [Spirochaetota bacterium]